MNAVLYCVRPWLSLVFVRCVSVQSDAPDPFVNLSLLFVQKASECCCPGAGQAESALNPHRFLTLCLSLCPFTLPSSCLCLVFSWPPVPFLLPLPLLLSVSVFSSFFPAAGGWFSFCLLCVSVRVILCLSLQFL